MTINAFTCTKIHEFKGSIFNSISIGVDWNRRRRERMINNADIDLNIFSFLGRSTTAFLFFFYFKCNQGNLELEEISGET